MSTMLKPSRAKRTASRCTLVTSGQVASITSSRRSRAWRRTAGETPCALKMARARRDFVQFLDEHRAGSPQLLYHVLVVHDFLADVDRRTVQIQRNLDHIDSPDNTGAETTGLEQKNLLFRAVIRCERLKRHRDDKVQL